MLEKMNFIQRLQRDTKKNELTRHAQKIKDQFTGQRVSHDIR